MSPKNEENEDDLTLGEIEVPEFKSNVPGYLADDLDKKDRYMVETLQIMAQKQDWVISIIVSHNRVIRKVENRTNRYEKIKTILLSKWSIITYILALIYPIIMPKLLQKFWP